MSGHMGSASKYSSAGWMDGVYVHTSCWLTHQQMINRKCKHKIYRCSDFNITGVYWLWNAGHNVSFSESVFYGFGILAPHWTTYQNKIHYSFCHTFITCILWSYMFLYFCLRVVKNNFPGLYLSCSALCITAEKKKKTAFYSCTQVLFPVAVHGSHFVFWNLLLPLP